jgi:hypothetical protein
MRRVLGVVDHHQLAMRPLQGDVAGAGLGARRTGRGDQHLEAGRQVQGGEGGLGFMVLGFQHDQHLQAVARIVQPGQIGDQLLRHRRLAIERRDDRVGGQRLVRQRRREGWRARREGGDQLDGRMAHEADEEQQMNPCSVA